MCGGRRSVIGPWGDRAVGVDAATRVRFTSSILPRWARRSRSLDALLPVLYLRGVSTGDFQEALTALLGPDAPNLSPGAITRLTGGWKAEYERWQGRDLSARRYVYVWGGRGVPSGPDGARRRVHARADRGDAGRKEGAGRLPSRRPRERAELARAARRPQGPRPRGAARDRRGRRRARLLEGRRRGLARDAPPTLLGAQERERPEQDAEVRPSDGEGRPARDLAGRDPGRRRGSYDHLRGEVRYQVRQGRPLPDQGTARRCWPSSTSRPSTGTTCAPRTPSRACSPR